MSPNSLPMPTWQIEETGLKENGLTNEANLREQEETST